MNKILRWLILIGIFSLPLVVPFIVSKSLFFPFITGKNFTFRIITEVIFAVWIILAVKDPVYRPKFSWILASLGAFVGVILLADIFGENPFKALWSNFERMEGFIGLAHLLLYFLVAASVLNTDKLWANFFRVSVIGSVIMSFYGFLQIAGKLVINQGGVRVDGTIGNAAYLAGYMLFNFFLALFLLSRDKRSWPKYLYGLATILQLTILYHTATRGAFIAFFVGLVVTLGAIALFAKENKTLRIVSASVILVMALLAVGIFSLKGSAFVDRHPGLARITTISASGGDAEARFMIWKMAFNGFRERPILGWGQEGFNYVFNKYYNPELYNREQWFDRTHDIIFDWLVAGGILGLLSYLLLLVIAGLAVVGHYPKFLKRWIPAPAGKFTVVERAILAGLLVSYFIQNLFVFDNVLSYLLFFSLLAYLHSRVSSESENFPSKRFKVDELTAVQVWSPIVLVVLVAAVYFFNIRGLIVARDLIQALQPQAGGVNDNISYIKNALSRNTIGGQEVREQLIQLASNVINAPAASQDVKATFLSLAESEMTKQIDRQPTDARLRVFYGSFLVQAGDRENALKHFEEAYRLSPRKQTIAFGLSSFYLANGQFDKALTVMKQTFEGAPENNEARLIYAAVAIYSKNNKLVEDLLIPRYGTVAVPDQRIVQAYFDTNQFGPAETAALAMAKLQPNDTTPRLALAAIYLNSGHREKSIAELQKVVVINPSFKAQADEFIKQIRAGKTFR